MKARLLIALVCGLLWASPSQAAWSLVNSDAVFLFNGSTSNAINHTAGNLLIAVMGGLGADGITVTSVANTALDTWLQCAPSTRVGANGGWTDIWYVKSTNGSTVDVVTPVISTPTSQGILAVFQYSGQDATAACEAGGAGTENNASTTVTSSSFSPAVAGNLNIAVSLPQSQSGTWTAGSGYALQKNEASSDGEVEDNQSAGSGAQTASIDNSNGASTQLYISIASFKPASGGGGAPSRKRALLGIGQ